RLADAAARHDRSAPGLQRAARRRLVGRSDRPAAPGHRRRGTGMTFDAAERVADAVLYEGYVLYPYRASSIKNKFRWQFGVVAPKSPHEDGEPHFAQTECVVEPTTPTPRLRIRIRFLRPQAADDVGNPSRSWLDGMAHSIDFGPIDLGGGSEPVRPSLRVAGV